MFFNRVLIICRLAMPVSTQHAYPPGLLILLGSHNTLVSHNTLKSGWLIHSVGCQWTDFWFFKISPLGLSQLSWVRKETERLLYAKQVLNYWTVAFQQLWLLSLVPQERKNSCSSWWNFHNSEATFPNLRWHLWQIKSNVACIMTQPYK